MILRHVKNQGQVLNKLIVLIMIYDDYFFEFVNAINELAYLITMGGDRVNWEKTYKLKK